MKLHSEIHVKLNLQRGTASKQMKSKCTHKLHGISSAVIHYLRISKNLHVLNAECFLDSTGILKCKVLNVSDEGDTSHSGKCEA